MYKSKLQVLCQKNSWKLPLYDTVRDGPDHGARFTATVTVNGATFESPGQFTSSKLAQNGAAEVAFNHFSALSVGPRQPISPIGVVQKSASPGSSASTTNLDAGATKIGEGEQSRQNGVVPSELPTRTAEDLLHTYKKRLQIYAQKRNLILPEYSCEIVGPPHQRLYKSKVTVDGKSFETPNFFSTLKDAEHGAAKVALESLSVHLEARFLSNIDEVVYKTLLQEHAQRTRHRLPTYDTQKSGPPHMPIFVSTVEIGGKSFQGQGAKTKKVAEMNAAKAAYICLANCQETQCPSPSSVGETSGIPSFNLQPDVTEKVEEDVARNRNISINEAQDFQDNNGERHINSTTSEDAHAREGNSSTTRSPPQDLKDGAGSPTLEIVIPPAQNSIKKIMIIPSTSDMIIPEGATVLPYENDEYVAITMHVPSEEYEQFND
uniref:DRBM domain-containing protein n=1 Tax=Daucus carota subsp. sativus TaxID=79200 RepID=A0A165ZRB7_DAUCS